jgi:MFS family permease
MNADKHNRFAAFTHRNYLYYWWARVCTTFAVQVLAVSVAWLVYDLTRNPFHLGILGLVQFLPLLLLVLVTGAVADRFGRRRVMTTAVNVELVCSIGMLVYAAMGPSSPMPIFILLMLLAVARAFFGPASQSLVVNLVPREDFANAITWNSSAWQIASIAGPAVGGLLYGISAMTAFGAACLMLVAASLLLLRIPEPPPPEQPRKVTFDSLFDGLRFIRTQPVVLGAISLDLFAVLLGGAVALLPVYARDILNLGPWGLGLLRAAPGVGALITAAVLAMRPIRDHAGYLLLGCVALFGGFTAMFGISTIPWISILLLGLVGASDMVSVVIRETLLQLWTPDEVRGRVNAANMVFLGASNELGEFRAGLMAAWVGVVPAVVFGGVGSIVVASLWAWKFPQLRDARYLNKQE